jgi:hypothetical protein
MTTMPAIAPPTIAPTLMDLDSANVDSEAMTSDVVSTVIVLEEIEPTVVDINAEEVSNSIGVDADEVFGRVSLDATVCAVISGCTVVVASTGFGTASKLSTANLWPHAMYSKD